MATGIAPLSNTNVKVINKGTQGSTAHFDFSQYYCFVAFVLNLHENFSTVNLAHIIQSQIRILPACTLFCLILNFFIRASCQVLNA